MGKGLRRKASLVLLIIALVIIALVAGGIIFIKSDYAARRMCSGVSQELAARLGVDVSIAQCSIGLLPPTLEANRFVIGGKDGSRLLEVDVLRVQLDSLALLTGRMRLERVEIEEPRVHLVVSDGKLANLPELVAGEQEEGGEGGDLLPQSIALDRARVDIVFEDEALVQLRDIQVEVERRGQQQFELAVEVGDGLLDLADSPGPALDLDKCKLKAGIADGRAQIDSLTVKAGDFSIESRGSLALGAEPGAGQDPLAALRPELDVTLTVPLARLDDFLPDVPEMQGVPVISFHAAAEGDRIVAKGAVDLKGFAVSGARGIDLQSGFLADTRHLRFDNLVVSAPAGGVSGKARLSLQAPREFSGEFTIEKASLSEALAMGGVLGVPVSMGVGGQVEFKGKLESKYGPRVSVSTDFDLSAFKLAMGESARFGFARGDLEARASFTGRRVKISSFGLQVKESSLGGRAEIGFSDQSLNAELASSSFGLGDFSPVGDISIDGRGELEARLGGTLSEPDVVLNVAFGKVVLAGHPVGSIRGGARASESQIRFDNLTIARKGGTVWLNGKMGRQPPHSLGLLVDIGGVRLSQIVSVATGEPAPKWLRGLAGGRLQATGSLDDPVLDFRMAFQDVWVGRQLLKEGGIAGRMRAGTWHLDLFEARMGSGWIFARGSISPDLELDLSAYSTGLRAGSFSFLADKGEALDFRLDLNVEVKGPLLSPSFAGWAKAYDTHLHGKKVRDSSLSARATTESIEIAGKFLGGEARLNARAALEEKLPFSADLTFETQNLGRYLPYLADDKHTRGELRGRLDAKGLLLVPAELQGDLSIDKLNIQTAGIKLRNRKKIALAVDGGAFEIIGCEITGPRSAFRVSGNGSLRQGPRLGAEGVIDLGILAAMLDFMRRSAGSAKVELAVKGGWSDLQLEGSASFDADFLRIKGFSQDLSKVSGRLRFTPAFVEVTRLSGHLGGGKFSGLGSIRLDGFAPRKLMLSFDVDRVRYQVSDDLWGIVSGGLSLTGSPADGVRIEGQLTVDEGGFREKYTLASLSQGIFRRRLAETRTYSEKREILAFGLRLDIPDNFKVDYNLGLMNFKAEMRGELRVTGTNERLGLLGEMEAIDGTLNYLTKDFELNSTRVQFTDEFSIVPGVDVMATRREVVERLEEAGGETEYRIDFRLLAKGNSRPEVALKSDPPLDESDIITLLHLGVTNQDIETLKGEDLVGLGGEILSRSFKLDEKLRTIFPFPPDVIQPKYIRVRSRYSHTSAGGGQKSGEVSPRLEVGAKLRFISDDLDLDYGRSLYDDADQNLDLTYKLSRGISTRVRWETVEQNVPISSIGNIGLDLQFHWEW